jgi:hypothetical protein
VDLAEAYDFSQAGEYTIGFLSPRISHVVRSEAEMAKTMADLGPVQMPSNRVTIRIAERSSMAPSNTRRVEILVGFVPEDDTTLVKAVLDTLGPARLPRSMKGYELYSWPVRGEWHFALVAGTNRIKTYDEISSPEVSVRGLDSLKAELDQLPSGEQVLWLTDRVPNVRLPPSGMIDEISTYCGQRGITLEIEPSGDEGSHVPTTVPVLTVVTSTGEHGIPLQEPQE